MGYSDQPGMDIGLQVCVESQDSIDRYIQGDIATTSHEFQTDAVRKISWIPGKTNLANPLTKKDNALDYMIQICLFSGRLLIQIEDVAETKGSTKMLRSKTEEY